MTLPPVTIGQLLGHYRIVERIGAGGMGVVYRAHDERLDRDMALKVLPSGALADEVARKRFRKEALILSKLNHPNTAHVYDFDTQDGLDFLVMEFVSGVTLAQKLQKGALPEKDVLSLGEQIAQTLQDAHEQGIVHRDLKPGNIMLTAKEQPKLLDFGLSKLLRVADTAMTQSLTEADRTAGTLPYMAPEQLRDQPSDFRTDIYAIGTVLYEMATGRRPFDEKLATTLADSILHKPPLPPSRFNPLLSPKLDDIILKCLEKEQDNRYQSATELAVDLRRLAGSAGIPASVPTAETHRRSHYPGALWGIAVLAVLALLFAGNIGGFRDRLFPKTAAGAIRSLAVLPLENLSHQPEQDYFADGMTDELITDLSKIEALRVISRTSMVHYKGTQKTLPEIARELNVDAIVEGSILRSGDRVRVTAQLIQAATDKHLWADSYERDMNDILGLQREVARAIAQQIRVTLKPAERARLTAAPPGDPRAYEAYLKGRYFSNKWTEEGLRKGIASFQEAIGIDPTYALAYAGLADSYNALGDFGVAVMSPREASCKAEASALKATELDGMLGEAHAALAMAQFRCDPDWRSADKEFARALELNPSYAAAHHWYAHYLLAAGRVQEALAESKRAYDLSPIDPEMGVHLQWHYYYTHDYDSAIQQGLKTMELDPTFNEPHLYLGMAYEQKGMYDDAIRELEKAVELSGRRVIAVSALGHAYALAGQTAQASKLLKELEDVSKHGYISSYDIAILDVGLGYRDQALTRLEQAYREGSYWIFTLQRDPRLDSLHSDPRFRDLVRRASLP
jgi:eukaryotic-like serine/threonine-protein kinase